MSWKMFIDDERYPVDTSFVIVRSVLKAQECIAKNGVPTYISFDHDLGENTPTGFDLAKWLVEKDLDQNGGFLPPDFDFFVHSANPVGAQNIQGLLGGYLRFKKSNDHTPIEPFASMGSSMRRSL